MPKTIPPDETPEDIQPFIRKGYVATPYSVKLLTAQDARLIRAMAFFISSIVQLGAYLLFGHWGIVVASLFIMVVAVGHFGNWIKINTRLNDVKKPVGKKDGRDYE